MRSSEEPRPLVTYVPRLLLRFALLSGAGTVLLAMVERAHMVDDAAPAATVPQSLSTVEHNVFRNSTRSQHARTAEPTGPAPEELDHLYHALDDNEL